LRYLAWISLRTVYLVSAAGHIRNGHRLMVRLSSKYLQMATKKDHLNGHHANDPA
jgi:hypothetical protein